MAGTSRLALHFRRLRTVDCRADEPGHYSAAADDTGADVVEQLNNDSGHLSRQCRCGVWAVMARFSRFREHESSVRTAAPFRRSCAIFATSPSAAGLVFHMNEKGYYALLVSPSAEYKKKLSFEVVAMTFQGDSFAESVIVPRITVDRASPTESQLAVQDIGDQITVLVDGQQVGAVHDHRFTDGYVGFTVSAPAQATFSNLLVEQR